MQRGREEQTRPHHLKSQIPTVLPSAVLVHGAHTGTSRRCTPLALCNTIARVCPSQICLSERGRRRQIAPSWQVCFEISAKESPESPDGAPPRCNLTLSSWGNNREAASNCNLDTPAPVISNEGVKNRSCFLGSLLSLALLQSTVFGQLAWTAPFLSSFRSVGRDRG